MPAFAAAGAPPGSCPGAPGLPRLPLALEAHLHQALGFNTRQVALIRHDRGAFLPQLLEVLGHLQYLGASTRHLLPPPRRLAGPRRAGSIGAPQRAFPQRLGTTAVLARRAAAASAA